LLGSPPATPLDHSESRHFCFPSSRRMAKTLRWQDLKIGLFAAAAVIAAALGVLIFGRVGTLHGKTFEVYVTTKAARGIIRGSEVWLDGQKVGLVRDVSFQPPTVDPDNRVIMRLSVLASARPSVRLDTRVQVRAGSSLIGDQVVYMSSGTARMREVADGDTIRSSDQVDFESLSGEAAGATKEFPAIIENVKLLSAQLKSINGTLGALGVEGTGGGMQRVRARASNLIDRLSSSSGGSVGLALSNRELMMARARRALAQTDSIRALIGSSETSLGRFRRDSTLLGHVTEVRAALDSLQRLAASPNGTIGRFRADSAIIMNIQRGRAALDSLIVDIKQHPLRYTPF
jgi:phospholipid/cholesterol/gamma-HCH transport system substrate-binding protein